MANQWPEKEEGTSRGPRNSPPLDELFDGLNRNELKEWFTQRDFSLAALSVSVGRSKSSLSQWFSGQYPGDTADIGARLVAFKKLEEEKAAHQGTEPVQANFVETTVAKEVYQVCRIAHLGGRIGVLYGQSGVGKSKAAKEYARRHPGNVIYLTCHTLSNMVTLLETLCRALNAEFNAGNQGQTLERVVEVLGTSKRMIIVDEAQFLNPRALEVLRHINDATGCAIVLVGMPRLFDRMIGRNTELYAQIFSRVAIRRKVVAPTETDVRTWLLSRGVPKALVEEFLKRADDCKGHLRTMAMALEMAQRMAEASGEPMNKQMVAEAFLCVIN